MRACMRGTPCGRLPRQTKSRAPALLAPPHREWRWLKLTAQGLVWAAVLAPGLIAIAGTARAESLDDRVYDVARQLMCPVCPGETAAQSDATLAREMRATIRQKLEAGETRDQILQYFVAQFGESVLAEPPRRGFTLFLYLGPLLALSGGLAVAIVYIRRWVIRAPPATAPEARALDPADLDRLACELGARDR